MKSLPILRTVYVVTASLLALGLLGFMLHRPGMEGDTFWLIKNAYEIPRCFSGGRVRIPCPEAGQYPLFQIIPSVILWALGVSQGQTAHLLAYLSAGVFACMLGLGYRALSMKGREIAGMGILILLAGYDLRYLNSSFGEMLAAGLVFSAVAGVLMGWSLGWVLAISFYAGFTKETAPPFVWFFVAIAWWVKGELGWRRAVFLGGVVLGSILCNGLFNEFRYGSFLNHSYMDPSTFVSLPVQIGQFFQTWGSWRVGVFFYWPFFFFLVVLCLVLACGTRGSGPWWRRVAPLGAVALGLGALSFGFAKLNFFPGWTAWGDRYMVPWLPVSVLLLLFAYGDEILKRYLPWVRAHRALYLGLLGGLCFLSLPNYRVLFHHQWVDLIVDAQYPSILSMLVPGRWLWEWVGSMALCGLLFFGWMRVTFAGK